MRLNSSPLSIYLASKSSRRLQLLEQIGVKAQIIDPNVPEVANPNESPLAYANRLAITKAQSGWIHPDRMLNIPVIGADTIVVCDQQMIGKPINKEDGMAILKQLSGRTHQVITAVAIVHENKMKQAVVESKVTFTELTDQEMESYWNTGEPCDKAGAYAIQGKAAMFISNLTGSYSGVVGLPLFETAALMREFNVSF